MEKKLKKLSKKKNFDFDYGTYAFGIGLLIALVAGFIKLSPTSGKVVVGTLTLLGIVIGFLNIRSDEEVKFLLASVVLVILVGPFLGIVKTYLFSSVSLMNVFSNLIALIVPAAIVVSLKVFFITAKEE